MARRALTGALAVSTVAATAVCASAAVATATGSTAAPTTQSAAYRHGAVPMLGRHAAGAVEAASSGPLQYGGGIDGIGVTSGHEKVYLVFYGSQWGTESTDSAGNDTFSGDPKAAAPYLQGFFKGLGTGGETWSGVMTQYCDGVATGATSCPASNTEHVAYPTGGALAGVWEDTSAASPSQATGSQLAQEAINAAAHFGNTTAADNRDAQYDIISPTGTDPDGYETGGFCAWHDYNADPGLPGGPVTSPYGDIAFTNMPYITDVGSSCGENFVNSGSAGTLDGFSIVNGHEYAETITDQNPAGGWTTSGGSETGDLCAWISSGQGASQNISLTTGSFAVQSTYANDFDNGAGGCEVSHPIVGNGGGGDTVGVTNPGNQTGTVGKPASLQIAATDSATGQTLKYTAADLPAGLSINSSSGLISGTPTTAATSDVTVTATDTTGASGSTSFTWTVSGQGGGATVTVTNPGSQVWITGYAFSGVQISATDSAGLSLTFKATGLPPGITISSSGDVTGTPTAGGTFTVKVTATDSGGSTGSTSFTFTVYAI